jgi:hypothetical protein
MVVHVGKVVLDAEWTIEQHPARVADRSHLQAGLQALWPTALFVS